MADVNRSLAGTATGAVTSGNPVGSPVANINDDNILTSFGAFEHVIIGNEGNWAYNCQVLFDSATINKAEIVAVEQAQVVTSGQSFGDWTMQLFYSGVWNTVTSGHYDAPHFLNPVTRYADGLWTDVTGIKLYASGHVESGQETIGEHGTFEL